MLFKFSLTQFALGLLAVFSYNGLYTLWWKKRLPFAAVPGALPGALPVLMGHVAATDSLFSPVGIYLFFLLFFWQMPHFWSLALRYEADYRSGQIPTLPVTYGQQITIKHIILWCMSYIGISLAAPLFLQVGWIYFSIVILTCCKLVFELALFSKSPKTIALTPHWLRFFLWVNFSLMLFLGAMVVDLWSVLLEAAWRS